MNDNSDFRRNAMVEHRFDDWQRMCREGMRRHAEADSTDSVRRKVKARRGPTRARAGDTLTFFKRANKKVEAYILSFITTIVVLLFFWSKREK